MKKTHFSELSSSILLENGYIRSTQSRLYASSSLCLNYLTINTNENCQKFQNTCVQPLYSHELILNLRMSSQVLLKLNEKVVIVKVQLESRWGNVRHNKEEVCFEMLY